MCTSFYFSYCFYCSDCLRSMHTVVDLVQAARRHETRQFHRVVGVNGALDWKMAASENRFVAKHLERAYKAGRELRTEPKRIGKRWSSSISKRWNIGVSSIGWISGVVTATERIRRRRKATRCCCCLSEHVLVTSTNAKWRHGGYLSRDSAP